MIVTNVINIQVALGALWVPQYSLYIGLEIQPENQTVSMDIHVYHILCSNARAPVAQLVRISDWSPEDPGLNPGYTSNSFRSPTK